GDLAEGRRELEEAAHSFPDDPEPQEALCRLLFEHGDLAEAEQALREKVRRDPTDAAAFHNLGTVHLRLCRHAPPAPWYPQSGRHRADRPRTYLQLGNALEASGQLNEAIEAWEQVLRLAPGDPEATAALRRAGGQTASP